MDFSSICRACLATKYLKPIFEEGDDPESFSNTVFITTGLKVYINDGLPQQMCKNCLKFIKDALEYRQLCKDVETKLVAIKNLQENYENNIKKYKTQKLNRKRKKSKDDGNINVKIESSFKSNDDVPLLQQTLIFTSQKNVKEERKLKNHESEETNDECAIHGINKLNKDVEFMEVKNNMTDQVEIEFVSIKNDNEIIKYVDDEKNNDNGQKNEIDNVKPNLDVSELESNISDDAKFETEFLDLPFDSDTDEHLTKDVDITEYSKNTEFPKYSMENSYKTEIPEYNLQLSNNDIENYNVSNNDNTENLIKKEEIEFPKYSMENSYKTKIPEYNLELSNNEIENYNVSNNDNTENLIKKEEIEFPKYSMENSYKTKIPEYNLELSNNEIENYNVSNNDNTENLIKKEEIKLHKRTKDLNINQQHKDIFVNNRETKDNAQTEKVHSMADILHKLQKDDKNMPISDDFTENLPFIIQDTNRVICKLCQKDLSKRSIYTHMAKSHPGADSRKVKCDLCDMYVLKERLKKHKVHVHGTNCFRCGYCKTEYESKEELLDHVVTCTAKKQKRTAVTDKRKELMVECDICNKSMQKASLRLHKEVKHAGMGPVCEHCGRRFGNKFRLSEHLRAKHGYEKFKCSMCDFLSASSMAVRNHERRHRGEKPFVCEQCGAKFHASHLLAQHKQSHRTEKNMKCDQCPAAFKANNALHMHKMTCHNTNTYQCPMCPRTYSSRHYAVKHLRSVHRHTGTIGALLVAPKEPHDANGLKT